MPKIFISYRRADSQYVTDAIYLQMEQLFGQENVFLDVGNIPFGVDFRQYLREQIESHDVVLVIIGPDWGRIMQERAEQTNDFVRIEIENAIKLNKLLIPVLVMEAKMPDFSALPSSIEDLQWRNSAQIRRHPDLASDCQRLAEGINTYFLSQAKISSQENEFVPAKTPKNETQAILEAAKQLIPEPFDWCYVPTGIVTLIPTNHSKKSGYLKKETIFNIKSFYMAKYPVTNGQFARFIEAGGYNNSTWWTSKGWKTRQIEKWSKPLYWDDSKWNKKDNPIVGLSWFEAVAFCLWLNETAKTSTDKLIPTINLPTEQQWQRAAQGDDGRKYPWGNKFDKNNSNINSSGIDKTTPVTNYPTGASAYGILDMVGNVWEWCLTDYETGNQDIFKNNPELVISRGSSWYSFQDSASTYFRSFFHSSIRNNYSGFRLVFNINPT